MNVLISIKPIYVNEIISGRKKYEYRKRIFKEKVDKIFIYSTSPECKIVGYFNYAGYITDTPDKVWDKTKDFSGIDADSYNKYFSNNNFAFAIKIEEVHLFKEPIYPKQKFEKFFAPQSYKYLKGDLL